MAMHCSIPEPVRVEIDRASSGEICAYLHGASRDGTFNRLHRTLRICQADVRWLRVLERLLERLGKRSWTYREGTRNVWVGRTRDLRLLGVQCGRIHNPSVQRAPAYWRFYVLTASHRQFVQTTGSWHPRKRILLDERALSLSIDAAPGDKLSMTRKRGSCRSVP